MGNNCRCTPLAAIVPRTYICIYSKFANGNEKNGRRKNGDGLILNDYIK